MRFEKAPDVQELVGDIVETLDLYYIKPERIFCLRSYGSTSNSIARIWAFERVWQQVLDLPAAYIIEVLSEEYDKLSQEDKEKTIIHELLHVPKTFSGATVPHKSFGKRTVTKKKIDHLYNEYKEWKKLPKIQ